MLKKYTTYFFTLVTAITIGCKKPYNPPIVSSPNSYLVVEGVINTGADSTIIKLSRTAKIADSVKVKPEVGAGVVIESDQNETFILEGWGDGRYVAANLNLNNDRKYRLRISTFSNDNQEYLSDFVSVKQTPPIDSIGYNIKSNGLDIYVNTHDPSNNARYYRWDYNETWQFSAKYPSSFITNGTEIVPRSNDQQIYGCFGNDISSTVVLGSSAKLAQDVIFQSPITSIASTSEKVMTKYSILLRQYALTKEAFSFWQALKKNTEQLGSIFDAQPSQLQGNIHNTKDPGEPVIGYISASNIQKKRVFISNDVLPKNWRRTYPYDCEADSALFCRGQGCYNEVADYLIPLGAIAIPIGTIAPKSGPGIIGYTFSTVECVDCTIRGTKKQPDFWK
jgi:hypothetical protein